MQRDLIVKSRTLGGTSDLTLLAPIKKGFIDSIESVTYKTRIKRVLDALHGARTASHEVSLARLLSDSVERVGVIQSVRVCVFEPEDMVLLSVSFDGSAESYIRVLWEKVGTLLDLIFCDTEGYKNAFDSRFDQWLAWAKGVQRETGFFYGPPEATARDVWFHRRVERMRMRPSPPGSRPQDRELDELRAVLPSAEEAMARLVQGTDILPDDPQVAYPGDVRMVRERVRSGLQGLAALYRLTDLYPTQDDGTVLRRAALQLLLEFVKMRDARLAEVPLEEARTRFARQLDWLFPDAHPAELKRQFPPPAAQAGALPANARADIQGGILRSYENVTHGLVVLLSFDNAQILHEFLKAMPAISSDADPARAAGSRGVVRNIAFTAAGLRVAGLPEDQLALFPDEYRQGMAARAGQLGDVRHNHPRRWRLPGRFTTPDAPPDITFTVDMESVHVVLQWRCAAATPEQEAALEYHDPHHPLRAELQELLRLRAATTPGLRILAVQSLRRNVCRFGDENVPVEHFGYADGDGQPDVEPSDFDRNRIHLGEIVHGHANAEDAQLKPQDLEQEPKVKARLGWLTNGSFLVMRKYRQYASRLEQAVAATAQAMAAEFGGKAPDYVEVVYGKLMGRTRDGMPMAAPDIQLRSKQNLFDYEEDKRGELCPLHAHIRRANPRLDPAGAGRLPRIMRRSLPFGPVRTADEGGDDAERGLLFMAYNADIGQQFEVLQRWLVGGNSTGGSSGQGCPIMGVGEAGQPRYFRFEHWGKVFRVALETPTPLFSDALPLTQLEWGLYLFAPSHKVLQTLRETASKIAAPAAATAASGCPMAAAAVVPWDAKDGLERIAKLETADDWKAAMEDPSDVDRLATASIWAAVREHHHGVLDTKTEYGTLVADRTLIREVLDNVHGRYSVAGQMERMRGSFGEIYLGLDDQKRYEAESAHINAEIGKLKMPAVFEAAFRSANDKLDLIIEEARGKSREQEDPHYEVGFESREVVEHVVADLIEDWFGLKEAHGFFQRGTADWNWKAPQPPLYPGHFTAISRFMFQPYPGPTTVKFGQDYGKALRAAMLGFVQSKGKNVPARRDGTQPAPLAAAAWTHHPEASAEAADFVARTLVGVIMGFSPTTIGAVQNILREWQRTGRFGALRTELAGADDFNAVEGVVGAAMDAAARMRPMPPLSWRTAAQDHDLGPAGHRVAVKKGQRIVLGNVSGTQQSLADGRNDGKLMFGGPREGTGEALPMHACPAYCAGRGAMLGTLAALLARPEALRQGPAPLTFIAEGPSGFAPAGRPSQVAGLAIHAALGTRLFSGEQERMARARELLATTTANGPRILAWGDSWTDYRLRNSPIDLGHDLRDCLENPFNYRLQKNFCNWETWPRITTMAANTTPFCNFLANELQLRTPRAILLSGGGNDSTEETLKAMIHPKSQSNATILDPILLDRHIANLEQAYVTVLEAIEAVFEDKKKSRPVLVHGYDHPFPRGAMQIRHWLRTPFESKGYDCGKPDDLALAAKGMAELIDKFNDMLGQLHRRFPRVVHVDLRGTIKAAWPRDPAQGWDNDLHPKSDAFALLAARLDDAIRKLPPPQP